MAHIVWSLLPIFALIALGYAIRRRVFTSADFWRPLEQLTYFILFPALLIHTLSTTSIGFSHVLPVFGVIAATTVFISAALFLMRSRISKDGPSFTSIFQGAIRFNTYVGLSAASALFGKEGVSAIAVVAALMIPLINLLCVLALVRFGRNGRSSMQATLLELARNPLIIAALVGIALSGLGLTLPAPIAASLDILGKAALPLGLLAVGAGLDLSAARGSGLALGISSSLKLIILPILTWMACSLIGVGDFMLTIAIIQAALPTATSAYILARVLGGDHVLMAGIITFQTICAAVTLPLSLIMLR